MDKSKFPKKPIRKPTGKTAKSQKPREPESDVVEEGVEAVEAPAQASVGDSSVMLAPTGDTSTGDAAASDSGSGDTGAIKPPKSKKPKFGRAGRVGFFNLTVKFMLAIAGVILLVMLITFYLISGKSKQTIEDGIDRAGINLLKSLLANEDDYWRIQWEQKQVKDYIEFSKKMHYLIQSGKVEGFSHDKGLVARAILVLNTLDDLLKNPGDLTELMQSISNIEYRAEVLQALREWNDKNNQVFLDCPLGRKAGPEIQPLDALRFHVANQGGEKFPTDLMEVVVYLRVPEDAPAEDKDDADKEGYKPIFLMSQSQKIRLVEFPTKPLMVEHNGKLVEVDNISFGDTVVDGVPARFFRAYRGDPATATMKIDAYISRAKIQAATDRINNSIMIFCLIGVTIGLAVAWGLSRLVVRPVRRLMADVRIVADGDLDHMTFANSKDEVGMLAHAFNEMTRSLRFAITAEIEAETKAASIRHELEIASQIQGNLLPKSIPAVKGYDLYAFYKPSKEVGGDYYDTMVISPKHLGLIVADVSGKGIPGALVMSMARSLIRMAAQKNPSTKDTLIKANRVISRDIRRGMFVTALYALLDITKGQLKFARAGHNPLLVYRAATGEIESINPKGLALGFDKGAIFDRQLEEQVIEINRGDRVVIYTDGVNEAMNEAMEEWGMDRFKDYIREAAKRNSKDFVDGLVALLDAHRGKADQHDDITVLTFRRQ